MPKEKNEPIYNIPPVDMWEAKKSGLSSHRILGIVFVVAVFAAIVSGIYYWQTTSVIPNNIVMPGEDPSATEINSFTSCIKAGNPVMESYPEQCRTEEGLTFVNYEACIDVIAQAKNPQTGEIREFPTPCDIPNGWEQVEPETRDI